MSSDKINKIDRSVIDGMSLETLQGLLQDDFNNPDGILDEDTQLYVIETLSRKEKEQGVKIPEAEASLEEFKREYLPFAEKGISIFEDESECTDNIASLKNNQKKSRKPAIRIVAAIAAALILCAVTASAMRFDVLRAIANWTRETFSFVEQADESSDVAIPAQLQEIKDNMGSYGASPDGLLPTYLPEGYAEIETQCHDMGDFVIFGCNLSDGETNIILQYKIHDNNDNISVYQKDTEPPEEYECGGITHYISTNEGNYFCVWINENIECSLMGVSSREELIKIIDSIY